MQSHGARLGHRRRLIATRFGNGYTHLRRERSKFGKAAVRMNAVEVVVLADIDAPFFAPGTLSAPPSRAGNDTLPDLKLGHFRPSRHHDPDHLVSENDGTRVTADAVRSVEGNHRRRL